MATYCSGLFIYLTVLFILQLSESIFQKAGLGIKPYENTSVALTLKIITCLRDLMLASL